MIRTGKPWHGAERELAYVLSSKRTRENGFGRLSYLNRVNLDRKVTSRKQRTDFGKYSCVNRTIQFWNQLPADV
jgi:hypothetical protein